jgi:hypothetical protein
MVQSLLSKVFPSVVIDGLHGRQTEYALRHAPASLALFVELYNPRKYQDEVLLPEDYNMKRVSEVDIIDILQAIAKAAQETRVPLLWLLGFAKIESNYDPHATNGGSRGLFQMQEPAWRDAGKIIPLPDYESNWMDPLSNARAAAAYLKISMNSLRNRGVDTVDPRHLYLAHQQGVSGFIELFRAHNSGVEPEKSVIRDTALMGNKPPGFKRTANRAQFYRNWMTYLVEFFPGSTRV